MVGVCHFSILPMEQNWVHSSGDFHSYVTNRFAHNRDELN